MADGLLLRILLHHPGAAAEDAGALQRFIDSQFGVFIASFLHTLGALLFTAGIIAYLLVARSLARAPTSRGPWLSILPYAHLFTVSGIVLNGGGGLMRLVQGDHPRLDQLGSSLWVQVLFVKHLLLVLGVGLALWVTWKTQAPEPEAEPVPQLGLSPKRIVAFSTTSFITIILATVLGVVATQAPLPAILGMDGDDMAAEGPGGDAYVIPLTAQGTIRALPLAPTNQAALGFEVTNATSRVVIDLSWTDPAVSLEPSVVHEDGRPVTSRATSTASNAVRLTIDPPALRPGNWTVYIYTEMALDERYTVKALLHIGTPELDVLEATVVLSPSTRFFEINLHVDYGLSFSYTWRVENNQDLEIYFDLHTHRGGQVQYPVRGHWNAHAGNWTQDDPNDPGVSLLWRPVDSNDVAHTENIRLHYRLTGEFHVDSVVGP